MGREAVDGLAADHPDIEVAHGEDRLEGCRRNAQAACEAAVGRHDDPPRVTDEAFALERAAALRQRRRGMKMAGDLAFSLSQAAWNMTQRDRAEGR